MPREHKFQFKVGDLVEEHSDLPTWYGKIGILIIVREHVSIQGLLQRWWWWCYSPFRKEEFIFYEEDLTLLKRAY